MYHKKNGFFLLRSGQRRNSLIEMFFIFYFGKGEQHLSFMAIEYQDLDGFTNHVEFLLSYLICLWNSFFIKKKSVLMACFSLGQSKCSTLFSWNTSVCISNICCYRIPLVFRRASEFYTIWYIHLCSILFDAISFLYCGCRHS